MVDPTLLVALGIPTLILVVSTLLLQRYPDALPDSLRRLARRQSLVWNVGIGLTIGLSAMAVVLLRR
ncbi:hypothetical protein EVJ50_11320 [Synechococcus sp. RSCCF101]|uniref:hypothetical protein n=1 Tax=Synechococcus sp. RSCCF101 TaxID=2511069 RepID=UPI001243BBD2|nr:hypothetical protein [Synechococcus sp. RSCCF101]QEY32727.1 hypothetical protein EVJ50_11320 [Synechococcus sp. RSCCF101]